jgi:TatD DNase family protein
MAQDVDFHCHLDLYPDHVAAVKYREDQKVFTLAVTTTPRAFPRNRDLCAGLKYVRAAVGLHPQLVGDRSHELSVWKEYEASTRYVGEVGLDAGRRFYPTFDQQKEVFAEILTTCAQRGDKILSVHSVRCAKVVLDTIEAKLPIGRGRVVLHWFTGSPSEAQRAVELGCFFSVNDRMFDTDRTRKLVSRLPQSRILTETDGPFAERTEAATRPMGLDRAVDGLATAFDLGREEIRALILQNLKDLTS